MSKAPVRYIALLALVAVGAAVASWSVVRYSRPPAAENSRPAGVPPLPDLTRWPAELRERLELAGENVVRADNPARALAELAELYLANNFATEAEQALRAAWQVDARNPRTAYFLGRILLRSENLPEAEALLRAATQLQPDYAPAWLHLGNIQMREKRFDEARNSFARRLALVPNDPEATFALAVLDQNRGAHASAVERLEAFVLIHPRLQEQRQMLAELHEAAGNAERATFHRHLLKYAAPSETAADPWMDGLQEASYDPAQLYLAGLRRINSGAFDLARRLLEKAARLSPKDEEAHGALAIAYLSLGRTDDARLLLEKALTRLPASDALHARLAEVLTAQNRTAEAIALLQRRLQASPKNPDLHYALGRALERTGRTEDAAGAFAEAIRLNPVSMETRYDLGRCLLQVGRRNEAKEQLQRALAMRPDHRGTLALLAEMELQEGNFEAADNLVSTLRELGPDEPRLRLFAASVKFSKGNVAAQARRDDEAEILYRQGLTLDPSFGQNHGGLGMLLAKRGQFDAAIQEFERYAELAPTDATPFLLMGTAHAQAGRVSEARAAFARGLAIARAANNRERTAQFEQLLAQ